MVQAARRSHFWPNGEDDIPGIAESQAEVERTESRLFDREGGAPGAALTLVGARLHSGYEGNVRPIGSPA